MTPQEPFQASCTMCLRIVFLKPRKLGRLLSRFCPLQVWAMATPVPAPGIRSPSDYRGNSGKKRGGKKAEVGVAGTLDMPTSALLKLCGPRDRVGRAQNVSTVLHISFSLVGHDNSYSASQCEKHFLPCPLPQLWAFGKGSPSSRLPEDMGISGGLYAGPRPFSYRAEPEL